MNLRKTLEPKDVEEIKPGFFIQKKRDTYKQVRPLVWKGEWRLKNQIKIKNVLMIALILALYFVGAKYVEFYEEVNSNPKEFCKNVSIDWGNLEVDYGDTNSIQIDVAKDQG